MFIRVIFGYFVCFYVFVRFSDKDGDILGKVWRFNIYAIFGFFYKDIIDSFFNYIFFFIVFLNMCKNFFLVESLFL